MQNLHKLKISPELREKMEKVICQQVKDAVAGKEDLDNTLVDYSNYLEGLTPIQTSAPWVGASNLQMPIVAKAYITVKSQLVQQIKHDPKVVFTAVDPDDDADAESLEHFVVAKGHQCGLTPALSEVANPTITYPLGIMYVGWKDTWDWKRTVEYVDTETGERVSEDRVDPERDYNPEPIRELDQTYGGVELRALGTQNWYIYPATAKDIQKAGGCGELGMYSETDLLLGISTKNRPSLDYDETAVYDLLGHGPCSLRDPDTAPLPDADKGVVFAGRREDDLYELAVWYCTAPIIRDDNGDIETPEYLWGEQLRCVVCPQAEIMLYLGLSEYHDVRPYVPFYMDPRTDDLWGRCLPQILETLQTNADVISQEYTNSLQLASAPAFKMKKSVGNDIVNEDFSFHPGAIFYYQQDPNELMPIEVVPPNPANLQVLNLINQIAEGLYAVSGIGAQDAKVRRAADIKNQQIQAQTKFDYIGFNFSGAGKDGSGTVEVIRRMVALYSEHMPDDGEEYMDESDHKQKITPAQLKKKFIITPAGSGNAFDQDTKQAHAQMAAAISEKYWGLVAQLAQRPDILNHLWEAYRAVLASIDVHNIEQLIGKQPEANPQPQAGQGQGQGMLPAMMGMQNGNNGHAAAGVGGMAQPQQFGGMAGSG